MKGFYDIEGTEICVGDEVLFTSRPGMMVASELRRGTVTKFTPKNIKIGSARISQEQVKYRVLVLKGEFKTYTKTEIERHDE